MRLELMNVFPFRMWSSWPAWLVATCICAITSAQRVDQEGVLTPRQSRLRDRESKPDEPTCDQLKAMWRFRYQYPSAPREAYGRVITKAPPNVVRTPDYGEIRSTEEIDPARTSPRVAEEVRDGAEARVKGDCRWTRNSPFRNLEHGSQKLRDIFKTITIIKINKKPYFESLCHKRELYFILKNIKIDD
ncbi:unnamed protein product [Leptidea sinapis]|uniref:Secreted protein n=1 Tax=Leptidea sinapis TaxID=189913 RepID=A0A5E4PX11_9NEOP|nr:unnamed protein product [Leptidea sinapis]